MPKISELTAVTTLTGVEQVPIVQLGTTKRTTIETIFPFINVKWYGATGDGSTDDTTAIQNALDAITTDGGGILYFPPGTYLVTSTLTTGAITHMRGAGANTSILQVSHTSGPGVTFTRYFSGIESMAIRGSSARLAAAAGTNYGIFFPTDDTVSQSRFANYVRDCQITNHSSHGVYFTGQACVVEDSRILDVAGHGIYGDNFDAITSYQFGFCEIKNTQIGRCTGHGVACGVNRSGFRLTLDNVDAFHCALTAGVRQAAYTHWLTAENVIIRNCGIGGYSSDTPTRVATVGGLYINGRSPLIESNRFIDVLTTAVELGANSDGARILDNHLTGDVQVALNPAVLVATGCTGVLVRWGFPANVTKAMTTAPNNTGNRSYHYDISPQGIRSNIGLTLLTDDSATNWEFTGVTQGVLILSTSSSTGRAVMVSFRVGDGSAFCSLLTTAANVTATTGTLSGTTGVDGDFTIAADTASNKLYVENRRGATVSVMPTFISLMNGELLI